MKKEKMKLQQKLFSFRLFVSIMCFIGIIFGGVMTFFFQDMFNAILANVSYISISELLFEKKNRKIFNPSFIFLRK